MPESSHPPPAAREPLGSSQRRAAAEPAPGDATVRSPAAAGHDSSARRSLLRDLPAPGGRIGAFVLEESIGVGGMGAVFRALDLRLDRHVALKLLPPEQAHDGEVIQRFYQEGRAAARLDHENIARVFTIGNDGPFHYIAFEYIDGTNIRQRVAEAGPLPVAEAVNYTLQIAGALVHAAARGVVHRDIKPSNIIVTPQGRAKLVDMGLARRFERGGADDGLTQSGMTLGTFDYISPEQARDPRSVDVRSDLYSLGCTLFHMLAGRPPFPEGTVLQKLLQHQAEPIPDVRSLNPAVPADLAAIAQKLMAKDRDRRYQAPELLARDLLALAGSLGLRSVSPEGLVWMSAEVAPPWERHLVWGLPTIGLALIVGLLVWLGEVPRAEPAPSTAAGPSALAALPPPAARPAETAGTPPPEPPPEDQGRPRAMPAEIAVADGAELATLLAEAPTGTTLVLTEDGPYDVRPVRLGAPEPGEARPMPEGRALTIRAAGGVRPVLRAAFPGGDRSGDWALLAFRGGRVVLEGLGFQLDAAVPEGTLSAVHAERVDLAVRRGGFRVSARDHSGARLAALRLGGGAAEGERPEPCVVEECHFDGGQVALRARGPLDALVRDCTFGPAATSFWLDNPRGAGPPVPARLGMRHLSILGGDGTVFRLSGAAATIRLDDSVIAPAQGAIGTLVATDEPAALDWIGRGNLYARIDTYLQAAGPRGAPQAVRRFDDWAGGSRRVHEIDSVASLAAVWQRLDPVAELARGNPAHAFTVDPALAPSPAAGARRGPYGPVPAGVGLIASAPRVAPEAPTPSPVPGDPAPDRPAPGDEPPAGDAAPPAPAPPMPMPMATAPMPSGEEPARPEAAPGPGTGGADSLPLQRDPFTGANLVGRAAPRDEAEAAGRDEVSTERELLRRLRAARAPGEPIRLAAGAAFDLGPCPIAGPGRWVLRGPGPGEGPRPRIRFRPGPADGDGASGYLALFHVQSAALELRDLDIELEPDGDRPWAAVAMSAGSDVNLVRCTVTMIGDAPRSALLAVLPPARGGAEAGEPVGVASIRVEDGLLRGGGDVVDAAPGARLELALDDAVVAAAGALVHGHGVPRGEAPPGLKVVLRKVAARVAGGLVRLESTPEAAELPRADVVGRDSLLATTPHGAPLFRVDGQGDLESLRDRIQWEGHTVAYHGIDTYRRDQTSQPGAVPLRFDRPDWEVAVGPREEGAFHGELRFVRPWDDHRPLWQLVPDDMRLEPRSPGRGSGPDLGQIPTPPVG